MTKKLYSTATKRPLKKATLAVHAKCPHCEFDINVFNDGVMSHPHDDDYYDNGHDRGRGGYATSCESCGKKFVIEKEAVQEVQHTALVLLGEAH